jgi:aminoglycoside phosphotransferase (APT) family kinase protein
MHGTYLGHLPLSDPLRGYLRHEIAPQLGYPPSDAEYRVFRFNCSQHVYIYEELHHGYRVVGKFYAPNGRRDAETAARAARNEYGNLLYLRSLGLAAPPFHVARPLGCNPAINNLLVVEYLEGELLGAVIEQAIHAGRRDRFFRKLSGLARFLAAMHNRTAGDWTVNFSESGEYMDRLVRALSQRWGLDHAHCAEFHGLREAWREKGVMWEDRNVLVHGDATPSNFLFGRGGAVLVIDLERMKWADRAFDLGRLCGEIKHFFLQATGDPSAGEPFIGHFLWEYCGHFPDRDSAFRSVARRLPFYMAITLLRIARNPWVGGDYRWRLIGEAKHILRAGL